MASPTKNYANPQDYKVFNFGNKPTPIEGGVSAAPKYGAERTPAMYSPYKMKGSPMHRNFGIGDAPGGVTDSPTKGIGSWFKKQRDKVKGVLGIGGGEEAAAPAEGVATPETNAARLDAIEAAAAESGGAEGVGETVATAGGKDVGGAPGEMVMGPFGMMIPKDRAVGPGGRPAAGGGGVGSAIAGVASDIRLKEKIQKTGVSPSGIPIYEFNYIGDTNRYSGAMAQDLLEMDIDAVSMGGDGYYRVNYNNIDVDMHLIN